MKNYFTYIVVLIGLISCFIYGYIFGYKSGKSKIREQVRNCAYEYVVNKKDLFECNLNIGYYPYVE